MSSETNFYKEILNKLERFLKKEYLHLFLTGIQLVMLAAAANFIFYSFIEMIAHFNSTVRTILFFLFILLVIILFLYIILIPVLRYLGLFRKENYLNTAKRVGGFFPEIKDDLLNAMQIVSVKKSTVLYSPNLVNAAFNKIYNKTKDLRFDSAINFNRAKKILPVFLIVVFVSALMLLFIPPLKAASYRLVNFNEEFIPPARFIFEVEPGDAELTKGEDINIRIKVKGSPLNKIYIALKNEDEVEFNEEPVLADSNGVFNYYLSSVRNSFKYFAEAEDIKSELYTVNVTDRPIVKTFKLTIIPPAYSQIPSTIQVDNGNITSLYGSKVQIEVASTKQLKTAALLFNDSSKVKLKTDGKNASGNFTLKGDKSYQINIADLSGNTNISPITYQINVLTDAFPSIDLIAPAGNLTLPNDNRVKIITSVADDFGFSKLLLHYRLSASRYEPVQKEFSSIEINFDKSGTEADINYVWNLTTLNLVVDDVVTYYLEVFDNDNVSGPKSAKTPSFTVRVPSLNEILADADETHSVAETTMEEVLQEAEELKETLKEIDQELKKDDEKLTWEEKEKIENALEKFKELQEKVDDVSDQMNEMRQNLQENNLLSEETLEKYLELQKLMDELTTEEMKKAMEQMQQLLQQMNREMTQDAMENLKMDEEKFKKSIERTLNLLKRIQIEQKVDELVKRTEELKNEQSELAEETSESDLSDKNKSDELSKKQDDITKQMNNLQKEMNELSDKMNELDDMPKEEMDQIMQQFEQQKNQQLSEDTKQQIENSQQKMAMQNQQQISENMNQMNQMMKQMQNSIRQQNQVQTFIDMMKIMDNLLELSKRQEELMKQSENLEDGSSAFNELSKKQNNLKKNLNDLLSQMGDLSQKTFAITPEMGDALGTAIQQMQMSMQSMQNRNGSFALIQQEEAMKSLNEAAAMMKSSMEGMTQGGSCPSGMLSLMQQLQQLSGQQMNINNMLQQLQQMMQGGLNPSQQQQLQRLAQQQQMIQKSLEQLNKEAKISGESKKLPADLDDIANRMREVITDMNSEKLDDNLIQKQERILSKLLDAQRSINERDFEKKRESRSGQTVFKDSPQDLNSLDEEAKNKILDELNRAVKEGYSKDYEELIRNYYELLKNENLQN